MDVRCWGELGVAELKKGHGHYLEKVVLATERGELEARAGSTGDAVGVLLWVEAPLVWESLLVDEVVPLAVASPRGRESGRGDGEVQLWDFQTALGLGEAWVNV